MGWIVRKATGNTPTISTNVIIPDFEWQHITMTWNGLLGGPNSKLYLNGSQVGNVTRNSGSGDVVSDVGNLFTIGNRPQNDSSFFKGWMDDFRIWERVITPNEVQQLYNGVPDENVTISGVVTDSTTVPGSVIMWVFDEDGNKLAEQILPNGPGAYSFSLVRGHSYDVKAFGDGNGNGSLDPGIGEPYAHWGSWNGNGFDLLPVDGNKTGIDISLSWEPDSDNDGFSLWQETMAGTSDNNSSSQPGLNFGLVGWWPFDGNASDMSGNENHGVVNGATLGADRFGQAGMAYNFDGVDDFIVVSDSNKFDFENRGFSISSWVKKFSQVNSNVGMVLSQWNTGASPGTNQWLLSSSTSGEIGKPNFSYEVANQTFKSTSSSVMGLNEWVYLVGVRESTHTKLFMNGSLVSQNVGSSGSINETGRDLYFGKYRDSNSIFSNISIDETRIYNRALSASEVQSLYQLESTPPDLNASVSGSVNYNGEINAPAIV